MFKRIVYLVTILMVAVGMLATTSPALADSGGTELKGLIAAVDSTAGTVTITPKAGGADVLLTVDATTLIRRNGKTALLADLQVGDKVEAKYDPATLLAKRIQAEVRKAELKGIITAIDTAAGTVAVSPKAGSPVTLSVDSATLIKRLGKTATIADLQLGDKVEAKYNAASFVALKIEAKLNGIELLGTIAAVDTAAGTVTITPRNGGADIVLLTDANTLFKRNGTTAAISDLLVGDKVEAKYNPVTMLASRISVQSRMAEIHGTISAVDPTASTVTIKNSKGLEISLTVDLTTIILKNDAPAALADLLVGDFVEAKYNPTTKLAAKIEVEDAELKGTVSAIDTTASTFTVTPLGGGADVTFTVDGSTQMKVNDFSPASLADLMTGDAVEVKYNAMTMLAFKVEAKR